MSVEVDFIAKKITAKRDIIYNKLINPPGRNDSKYIETKQ